ncbi:unnamed protein product, partial [Fusarium fujikuroi]
MVADGMSVNKAAEACGINRSTLQGRIKGSATPREAQKPRQKLSDTQEKSLRDWIVIQADLGCPVSHQQARREAITKSNAIAGFKATGLWPVNLAKVLMNPMVTETPSPAVTANSPAKEQDLSLLKTPRSSVQLRQALGQVPASATQDPTVRLLFRKIGSQLDRHNFDIERQNREISVLQRENEENRPKRRKKVVYNPNAEFAKIPAIKKAREQMWKTLQPERTANKVKKLKLEDL